MWSTSIPESPLLTFDYNDEYVYDIKWHPSNPSLFASVDGKGNLDFWDLNKDTEIPVYRHEVGFEALSKMSWAKDGRGLAVGDEVGRLNVFTMDKEVVNHKLEDSNKFEKVISTARASLGV